MKVLHILYQSHPNISGSSTRTRDILNCQKHIGIKPIVITSPFQKGLNKNYGVENIYGVPHFRTYSGKLNEQVKEDTKNIFINIKKFFRIISFKRKILKLVLKEKPDILNAHAMFFCAYPTILIGKKMQLPVFYEVRSLWEERRKDFGSFNILRKIEFMVLRKIETYCINNANHIVVINENLKQDIIKRGILEDKITVIGNAVDIDFLERQRTRMSKEKRDSITFGYVGSISPIEGLDSLIELFKTNFEKNRLLIYGRGKESYINNLKIQISDYDNIEYRGEIDRNEIFRAYENIDIIVNPRVKLKITDTVTPLKPLEAMAIGKIVIASNVGGMKELIDNDINGFLFEADSINELERCIKKILNLSLSEKQTIISNAISFIKSERLWSINAFKYKEIYEKLQKKYIQEII
jgi:glycogen synthase